MTTPASSETVTGKLKRIASGMIGNTRDNAVSANGKAPSSGFYGDTPDCQPPNASTGQPAQNPQPVAGFTPGGEYPLSVSLKEASRGYGKAATGNKRLMYVEVDGWEGLAVCHVHDRGKWRPHQRLTGLFHRLTPDYMLEFACHPDCAKR